jgi:hypothetical protein
VPATLGPRFRGGDGEEQMGINRPVRTTRTPCERRGGVGALAAAGIPIWIDARARIAHQEALIIDRRVTTMRAAISHQAPCDRSDAVTFVNGRDGDICILLLQARVA